MAIEESPKFFYEAVANGISFVSAASGIMMVILAIYLIFYIFPNLSIFFTHRLEGLKQAAVNFQLSSKPIFENSADTPGRLPEPTKKVSIKAILAMLSVLIGWSFGALPAVILGHMALKDIRSNPDLRGESLARIGLFCGYFFLAVTIVFVLIIDKFFLDVF